MSEPSQITSRGGIVRRLLSGSTPLMGGRAPIRWSQLGAIAVVRSGRRQYDESTSEAACVERISAGAEQCERQCIECENERSHRGTEVRTDGKPDECVT